MKKRSYAPTIIGTVVVIVLGIFLICAVFSDPYESAIKKGDRAMEKQNYYEATSQYSIAQKINSGNSEAYLKNIMALAKNNDVTVVRDILTEINNCIDYCEGESITVDYICDVCDVLVGEGNGKGAYDILNHIHYTLASDEKITSKMKELERYASENEIALNNSVNKKDEEEKTSEDENVEEESEETENRETAEDENSASTDYDSSTVSNRSDEDDEENEDDKKSASSNNDKKTEESSIPKSDDEKVSQKSPSSDENSEEKTENNDSNTGEKPKPEPAETPAPEAEKQGNQTEDANGDEI